VILETSRLTLREAEHPDAFALAAYQSDPRYLEHYPEPPDAARIVELARRWASDSPRLNHQFVATLGAQGPVIGCAGLRQAGHLPGVAEVGVELNPEYWGAGYAREVLSRLIEFARNDFELNQLLALTAPTNRRAHDLLLRLGFSVVPSPHHEGRFQLALATA
jgi:ribosomal-protein-alanine N-acetyltransferase